ncbi:MAG: hypothetical protein ABIO67_06280 [Mycobacteriales bacterium]
MVDVQVAARGQAPGLETLQRSAGRLVRNKRLKGDLLDKIIG